MRFLSQVAGIALMLGGIYCLGQNIIFTTQTASRWWRDIPAVGSVLCLLSGIIAMVFGGRSSRELSWILLGLGILMIFLSGGVILRPTSLWTLFLAAIAMVGGYKLLTTRDL